ncbi:uncharacterized protein J2T12_003322 [Paenibacillus anaericanus]|uniref:Cys-rich peptide radical SAM maturase CcpM n=1 Tax=Paenibacillus anaericanus TaxID=170367 RepID=UPI002782D2B6|nr:Cys-rich peptide radical SAM maturase CcpM [Paenibacillus anaericanus]MDQ0089909.1 uncharacterized protein [Paenibacillus anaericanus]
MIQEHPFIFLFRTPGCYYVYDVNTNIIVMIDKETFEVLEDVLNDKIESEEYFKEYDGIATLINKGFLSANKIKQIEHSESRTLLYTLNNKVSKITLQVTQQCNLRCKYCVYSGSYMNRDHSAQIMTFEMASKGINFLIDHSMDLSQINIGFYGGEPLLEFPLIKECIEYAETKAEGKRITFNITTNGTVLTDKIIEYLELHNVSLMISLDGPREVQDKNRRFASRDVGTFDKIISNLEAVKSKYPEYYKKISFNAVMDPQNDFNCSSEFFSSEEVLKDSFINASALNTEYSENELATPDSFIEKWSYEVFKLFLSKLGRLDEKWVSKLVNSHFDRIKVNMHEKRKPSNFLPETVHHGGPCIPGAQRLFMNVHGNFYPCERVSELSQAMNLGNVDEGFDIENARKLLNIGNLTENECKNCWNFRFCTLCAAACDNLNGLSREHKLTHCSGVTNSVEDMMKDYCTLLEFGYTFSDVEKPTLSYRNAEMEEVR